MGTMWWMVHQWTLHFSYTLHPNISRRAELSFGKPSGLVTNCWFQHRKTGMWLVKSHRANFTAEQGMEISWRAHLSCTGISPPHAIGSTRVLNTEISSYGAPWSRFTLKCEYKICACKTQLLNRLITPNNDSHSKEKIKEIIAKIYFPQQPLTSCHIWGYFLKNVWHSHSTFHEWGVWNEAAHGINGQSTAGHGLEVDWCSVKSDCLIFRQWRKSRLTFQHSVAWEYLERRDCWEKAVCWGNVDV